MAFGLITVFSFIMAVGINGCWIIGSLGNLRLIFCLICIISLVDISLIRFIGLIGLIGVGFKITSKEVGSAVGCPWSSLIP